MGVARLADAERAEAERTAAADQALGGQADQRIGALDLLQRVDEAVEQRAIVRGGDEVDDHLGIACRLKDRTAADAHLLERRGVGDIRSEEHTSELQSLMRISYAVFCLKKKTRYSKTISDSKTHQYPLTKNYTN